MSIITQALKKAQSEQRANQPHQAYYDSLAPARPKVQHQRSSRLLVVGGALLLGAGVTAYFWPSLRDPIPIAMTVPASTAPVAEAKLALAPSMPGPSDQTPNSQTPNPWVYQSPAPSALPSAAPPSPTEMAKLEPPQTTPEPQTTPTAAAEPMLTQPAQIARAQQQLDRGLQAYNAGSLDEAEVFLQEAITLDPTLKYAFNSLGNLYYQRETYERARAMYEEALALDPDYIKARNNLGNTYMQLNMSFKAITELTKAILADSESGLAYYNMACAYARSNEPEKAIRYLGEAIVRDPEARRWAKTDTDFSAVRSKSEFQKLLGTSS